jgi:hypothetical protein
MSQSVQFNSMQFTFTQFNLITLITSLFMTKSFMPKTMAALSDRHYKDSTQHYGSRITRCANIVGVPLTGSFNSNP